MGMLPKSEGQGGCIYRCTGTIIQDENFGKDILTHLLVVLISIPCWLSDNPSPAGANCELACGAMVSFSLDALGFSSPCWRWKPFLPRGFLPRRHLGCYPGQSNSCWRLIRLRLTSRKSWEIDRFKRRKGSQYVRSEKMPVPTGNRTRDLWFT